VTQPPRPRHDPFEALRQPTFSVYLATRLAATIAMTLLTASIAFHVYEISDSALQLAMLGLARFVPSLGLSLVGGAVADRYDRRKIVMAAQCVPLLCSTTLFFATLNDSVGLPLIYGLVLMTGLAASFENPARQALLPQVVTRKAFPNAIVVSSTVQSLGFVTGPTLGGFLIGWGGLDAPYLAHMVLIGASLFGLLFLRLRAPEGERRAVSIAAIREGLDFVIHRQVLLGVMTLDMFAVIFGGATALLPVVAKDILHVGGFGYGLLYSALDIGALTTALALVFLPPIHRAGRTLLATVALFGLATMVFGISRNIYLSIGTYMVIGMADQVSVVLRSTAVQLTTPDELRGRVSSVNSLFIGASNQLGAVESGLVAAATNATFAIVTGGIGCIAVVGVVWAKLPGLRNYVIERPRLVLEPAPGSAAPATASPGSDAASG
jgi:MFS family permease